MCGLILGKIHILCVRGLHVGLGITSLFSHTQYSLHITLVDQCLKIYREGINEVCKVEQNLATGTDPQGEPITDPMKDMMPCLFNRKIR